MENKLNLPAPLKPFLRFFAQAQSLDASNPAVAYFCRLFAVERILSSGVKDKEAKHFIGNMVSRLESDASKLGSSTTAEEGQPLCEQLALSIFNHADEVDRSQQSDKSNALAFYASSVIFEICQYFGPLSPDLSEKCKYAQFKCAEISKAIREGRLPSVAAPVSSPVLQAPKAETATVTAPENPHALAFVSHTGKHDAVDFITGSSSSSVVSSNSSARFGLESEQLHSQNSQFLNTESRIDQCTRAERSCRLALSSLHFQDINSAVSNLEEALSILKPFCS
jgi:vacuolar protein sorting-associated protein VTA1